MLESVRGALNPGRGAAGARNAGCCQPGSERQAQRQIESEVQEDNDNRQLEQRKRTTGKHRWTGRGHSRFLDRSGACRMLSSDRAQSETGSRPKEQR